MSQKPQASAGERAESPFRIEELFFSRTDDRGVIRSGNSVFQRVAHYDWNELIGAPHKLIRHNDMPKAVFHMLWDTIKAGKPIGAYVKNRAKTGQYYWVFAFVTPIKDGYLSVRLKPSSALFGAVAGEYKTLRALELADSLPAAASAEMLLTRLGDLGWRNYAAFMVDAAMQEVCARDKALNGKPGEAGAAMGRILELAAQNQKDAEQVLRLCETLKYTAINLSIHSSKNAAHRQLFNVISSNFARVCDLLKGQVRAFIASAQDVSDRINEGLFLLLTARMQSEIAHMFRDEHAEDGTELDQAREADLLFEQSNHYTDRARASLQDMLTDVRAFQWRCDEMMEHVGALGVTGDVGLIETARLDRSGSVTFQLLAETARVQEAMETALKGIIQRNADLERTIELASAYGRPRSPHVPRPNTVSSPKRMARTG
ncbi:PAS domain-containing protein [Chachezhania sediminis]|uniref:PAS domain-containing protein n=1 Tax=Chachezhania sediminis TaxID=2599291 RepID=UPI00131AC341|nr:PAS domain-containing protein [Chachezhania sediminis]